MTERGRRVLVVEDDLWIREVLGEALVDEGWETRDAGDGRLHDRNMSDEERSRIRAFVARWAI